MAPGVKVVHKRVCDGVETLTSHIQGFYPKAIDTTWRKNEEVLEAETLPGNVVPNSYRPSTPGSVLGLTLRSGTSNIAPWSMTACLGILTQLWSSLVRTWKGRGGRQVEGQYLRVCVVWCTPGCRIGCAISDATDKHLPERRK